MRFLILSGMALSLAFGCIQSPAFAASKVFVDFCANSYQDGKKCPANMCQLQCADGSKTSDCEKTCVPKECNTFSGNNCPKRFCAVVTDCSEKENCIQKPPFEQIPSCTGLGDHPQFAGCCSGLVSRCGFDYLDGKCNMEGKNTAYNFPICIPCGDGVCSNFENHCNCPEDCKKDIIPL